MRTVFGHGGPETEARVELALAEFRVLGERWGISLALSELAGPTCRARRVRRCLRVLRTGDRGPHRSRRRRGCHRGADPTGPAVLAQRRQRCQRCHHRQGRSGSAEGVTWPYALVTLALAKAELARLGGDPQEARRQLGLATTLLGDAAEQPVVRAELHNLLGYLVDDLQESRIHRVAAVQAASEAGSHSRSPRCSSGSRTWRCATNSTSRRRGCSRRAPACADWRIGPTRMGPGSSRPRGVTSVKYGSPRRRRRARGELAQLVEVTLDSRIGCLTRPPRSCGGGRPDACGARRRPG